MSNCKKQEQRTDLMLRNVEKYVVYGDLIITNSLDIENTTLIVSGSLIFANGCSKINSKGCDILAESIVFGTELTEDNEPSINIEDTDIFVQYFSSTFFICTDGIIDVKKDLDAANYLSCLDLFVEGKTSAQSIQTMQDAYFGNDCDCHLLSARDVFVDGILDLNGYRLNNFGDTYVRFGILNQGTYEE